jgi:hypothetical protein
MSEQKSAIIPSKIFSSMIKTMNEKKQIELMKPFSLEIIPTIFTRHNIPFTNDNLIEFCFERIGLWSGMYNAFSRHTDDNGNLCLVFEHVYGTKWSRIISESISNLLKNMLNCSTEQKVMPNMVMIKVLNKK